MDQTDGSKISKSKGLGMSWGWAVGLFACLAIYLLLGFFDRSTELTPSHNGVQEACFIVAASSGLAAAGMVLYHQRGLGWWKRVYVAVLTAVLGFAFIFLMSDRVTRLAENAVDFPAGRTHTKRGLLAISRAYRTHGKGQSWNIQTTPLWSNLDITRADYEFMLAHQPPDGLGRDGDEIRSHGYFCAIVLAQVSGSAIRILHAGSQTLPQGTVVICPTGMWR